MKKPTPQVSRLTPKTTPKTPPPDIGTRFEKSLHRELKFRYAGEDGQTEAEVGGFVADVITAAGEYIEIQTGSFGPLRKKVPELASRGKLRIVHPVISEKTIEVFDTEDTLLSSRTIKKRVSSWDIFKALVYAPELPLIRRVAIELVFVDVTERHVQDGKGSWRRKGASIRDRYITSFHESVCFKGRASYRRFLPYKKGEQFSSRLLREKVKIHIALARKALYVLVKMGIAEIVGKQGSARIYQIT